ncbi:MAG: hypothetical protein J7641_00435, partial [Cyanobacteria bacterium SID2]|nr:hypothetical protein [Cyanobacteria bacterium SID2]
MCDPCVSVFHFQILTVIGNPAVLSLTFAFATPVQAMHIMEGFLPADWAAFWWAMFLPFFILGVR